MKESERFYYEKKRSLLVIFISDSCPICMEQIRTVFISKVKCVNKFILL